MSLSVSLAWPSLFLSAFIHSLVISTHLCLVSTTCRHCAGSWEKKRKKESEVAQSCPTLCDHMDSSLHQAPLSTDSLGKSTGVGCHRTSCNARPDSCWWSSHLIREEKCPAKNRPQGQRPSFCRLERVVFEFFSQRTVGKNRIISIKWDCHSRTGHGYKTLDFFFRPVKAKLCFPHMGLS